MTIVADKPQWPHGLNGVVFKEHPLPSMAEGTNVFEWQRWSDEGLQFVHLTGIVDGMHMVSATACYVDGDVETFEKAKQLLMDLMLARR